MGKLIKLPTQDVYVQHQLEQLFANVCVIKDPRIKHLALQLIQKKRSKKALVHRDDN